MLGRNVHRSFVVALPALLVCALGAGACGNQPTEQAKDPAPKASGGAGAAAGDLNLDGFASGDLTPREKKEWTEQVQEVLAPCPNTPVSLAVCVKEKRACNACDPAVRFLLRMVKAGAPKKQRAELFDMRFGPSRVKTLVLDGSPVQGPPDAPVTIVEWADFQCPFCKAVSSSLDYVHARWGDKVRVVFKFFPLSGHPQGEISARAGWAAFQQGKFWEMHHMMFDHQQKLEQTDLERYAKKLTLDVSKFRETLTDKSTTDRISLDMKQAESLGLEGTPLLFVNGREVPSEVFLSKTELDDWIDLELRLAGQAPKPDASAKWPHAFAAPPGSGSASPSASAGPPEPPPSASAKAPSPPPKDK